MRANRALALALVMLLLLVRGSTSPLAAEGLGRSLHGEERSPPGGGRHAPPSRPEHP